MSLSCRQTFYPLYMESSWDHSTPPGGCPHQRVYAQSTPALAPSGALKPRRVLGRSTAYRDSCLRSSLGITGGLSELHMNRARGTWS